VFKEFAICLKIYSKLTVTDQLSADSVKIRLESKHLRPMGNIAIKFIKYPLNNYKNQSLLRKQVYTLIDCSVLFFILNYLINLTHFIHGKVCLLRGLCTYCGDVTRSVYYASGHVMRIPYGDAIYRSRHHAASASDDIKLSTHILK
jgi:hypothetical protein